MKLKCPYCSKEYATELNLKKHIEAKHQDIELFDVENDEKVIVIDEKVEEIDEKVEEIVETDADIFKNPNNYPTNKQIRETKKLPKVIKVVAFFKSIEKIKGLPQDTSTRNKLFALYNEYYNIRQNDCSDCVFEDIYSQLQRVAIQYG